MQLISVNKRLTKNATQMSIMDLPDVDCFSPEIPLFLKRWSQPLQFKVLDKHREAFLMIYCVLLKDGLPWKYKIWEWYEFTYYNKPIDYRRPKYKQQYSRGKSWL